MVRNFYDRAKFDVKKKISDLRQNIEFGLCHTHDTFNWRISPNQYDE